MDSPQAFVVYKPSLADIAETQYLINTRSIRTRKSQIKYRIFAYLVDSFFLGLLAHEIGRAHV